MKAEHSKSRQYTIRNVPADVDRALRQKAKSEGRSLNDVTLEAVRRGVNGDAPHRFTDLDHLIGTWVENPEFDKVLEEQRQIDPELWR